jgi:hypothetical protein
MKKPIDDKLNDFFGIATEAIEEVAKQLPVTPQKQELLPPESAPVSVPAISDSRIDDDYEYARGNLKGLIENGKEVMSSIMYLAKEGESPRAYEVVGQLIKTLADTNKDLLDLPKKARDAKGPEDNTPTKIPGDTINNTLFVGSTSELQDMLKNK